MRTDGQNNMTRLADVIRFAIASTYIFAKVTGLKEILVVYEDR